MYLEFDFDLMVEEKRVPKIQESISLVSFKYIFMLV